MRRHNPWALRTLQQYDDRQRNTRETIRAALNPKLSAHQTDQEDVEDERQGIRRKVTANQAADECAQGFSGEPLH
jgi:hypothetical protein